MPVSQTAELYENLKAQRDALAETVAPLLKKRVALLKKIQPLEDELRELNAEIKKVNAPAFDLEMEVSKLARAMGAKILSAKR